MPIGYTRFLACLLKVGSIGCAATIPSEVALAGATIGVMQSASLAVAMIGQALAQARGLVTKQAIKQVERMRSNNGIGVTRRTDCGCSA